jgi:hypothetical protein
MPAPEHQGSDLGVKLGAIVGGVVAVATVISAMILGCELHTMRGQVATDQRPWLFLELPALEKPAPGEPLRIVFNVKNAGKTPGTIRRMGSQISFLKPGVPNAGVGTLTDHGLKLDLETIIPNLKRVAETQQQSGSFSRKVSTRSSDKARCQAALLPAARLTAATRYT